MRYLILSIVIALAVGTVAAPASAQTLFALVDTGELFTSSDNGENWTVHAVLPVSDASGLIAGSDPWELFLASASGTIYRSTDAGANWVAVSSVGASDIVDLAGRTDGMLLALTRSGTVYASADHGGTFHARGVLTASNQVALARGEANRIYALTETGEVSRSNDAGQTWITVGTVPVSDAVTLRPLGSLLFVMTGTGLVYRSGDLGVTWTAVGTVSQTGMVGLVEGYRIMLAVTREGMVASSRNGASWDWVGAINQLHVTAMANDTPQTIGVPSGGTLSARFTLAPPWPNPLSRSDGRIGVGFNLPEPATVTLRLFDASGRLVDERPPQAFAEAGDRSLSWRPSTAGAGVYFLHVTTDGGGKAARRVVILP